MEAEAIVAALITVMRPWRRKFAAWGAPDATIRRLERAFSRQLDGVPNAAATRLKGE